MPSKPYLLSPIDLQAVKASGVTFVVSLLERVIEEQARGSAEKADAIRADIAGLIGARPLQAQARLRRSDGDQGQADRARRLVAISRGRHRAGRRDLHQMPADGVGRLRRRCRPASGLDLEQSGAGDRRDRARAAARSSARRSATTSICATSRAARRCCSARPRTTTPRPRSGRSSGCSTTTFSIDDVKKAEVASQGRGRGRVSRWRAQARWPRSAARRRSWSPPRWARTTSIPTAWRSISAPCSRRRRTAARRARASPTRSATSSRSRPTKFGALANRVRLSPDCPRWTYGASHLMRDLARANLI